MARITAILCAATVLFGAARVMAADGDVRTCALLRAIECDPVEGCKDRTIKDMDIPRFVRIDLASRVITSLDKEVARSSKITTVERQAGLAVLHGTEKRGWSIALGEDSGALTLTASGENEGFIVFGSCMNP